MSKRSVVSGPVKDPTGNYPKLLRLLDQYFLKEAVPDRSAVAALDTLVRINGAVLERPESVNLRSIRTSEREIRTLIEYGGTDILTQIGWQFRVSRMEETWQLPYDADLSVLGEHQAKLVEAQRTLQRRFAATRQDAAQAVAREKEAKLAIVRQIEQDALDKKLQQAMRKGEQVPVKQSLDEARKQAVKERLARQQKKQQEEAAAGRGASSQASSEQLPGSFPQDDQMRETVSGPQSGLGYDHPDDDPDEDDYDEDDSDQDMPAQGRRVSRTGLRSAGGAGPPQRPRRTQPSPIDVRKKEPPKERYQAGTHTLGGPSA
ncbi:hypothetical protein BCR37DRAFT_401121 [Protomyces lactucae-debilis]|uniref:PUB domain-containing protein n=1 Tax=Protomyces lactucae-debilis TaxID=2754530 RepID=A0A1Y2EV55_PROLT|nr:uncharacterized protein BCR37DRAFT_401121 [Protomyces lactucae-debilis]ORY75450.1 hypothetical protein BCR37DRAFT_401121 [Protomyces lactucae-debilis]